MDNRITITPPPAGRAAPPAPGGAVRGAPAAAPASAPDGAGAQGRAAGPRPGGFGAMMDEALGPSRLPEPLELVSALEAARTHADRADRAVPGLGRLVAAVIEDETRKLARYLDLSAL